MSEEEILNKDGIIFKVVGPTQNPQLWNIKVFYVPKNCREFLLQTKYISTRSKSWIDEAKSITRAEKIIFLK